ncbi:1-acyl-sn-glycerol-3-phosphate acyltransferase [Desulfovibrionales bacterium]
MLRKLWATCYFIPLTFFFTSVAIFVSYFDRSGRIGMWCGYHWSRLFLKAAGIRIHADLLALKDLPPEMPCVLMANHQSYLDVFAIFTIFPHRTLGFIAKDTLFHIPIIGPAMRQAGHIPINRSHPRRAMKGIDFAVEQSKRGHTIVIFPEGTRNKWPTHLSDYKIGGMVIAIKCGLPIMPVILAGTREAMPGSLFTLNPAHRDIRVRTLPPVVIQGFYTIKDRERLKDDLYALMNSAYLELRDGPGRQTGTITLDTAPKPLPKKYLPTSNTSVRPPNSLREPPNARS